MIPDLWLFQHSLLLLSLTHKQLPQVRHSLYHNVWPKSLEPSSCQLKSLKIRRKRSLFLSSLSLFLSCVFDTTMQTSLIKKLIQGAGEMA